MHQPTPDTRPLPTPFDEPLELTCSACQQPFPLDRDSTPGQCIQCRRVVCPECLDDVLSSITKTDVPQQPQWQDDPGVSVQAAERTGKSKTKGETGKWDKPGHVKQYGKRTLTPLFNSLHTDEPSPLVAKTSFTASHLTTFDMATELGICIGCSADTAQTREPDSIKHQATSELEFVYHHLAQTAQAWLIARDHYQAPSQAEMRTWQTRSTANQFGQTRTEAEHERASITRRLKGQTTKTVNGEKVVIPLRLDDVPDWELEYEARFWTPYLAPFGDQAIIDKSLHSVLTVPPLNQTTLLSRKAALKVPEQETPELAHAREHALTTEEVDDLAHEAYVLWLEAWTQDGADLEGLNHAWTNAREAWKWVAQAYERLYRATPPPVTINEEGQAIINTTYQQLTSHATSPEQAAEITELVHELATDPLLISLLKLELGETTFIEGLQRLYHRSTLAA